MNFIIILMACFMYGYGSNKNTGNTSITWEEKGHTPFSDLKSGLPVYNETAVTYLKDGKELLKVTLGEPVVIDVAKKKETWGFFQFPDIYYNISNQIVASWSMHKDDISSYGHGSTGYAISEDGGKSWVSVLKPTRSDRGLLLPNGDRINVYTPKALEIANLELPEPVSESFTYYPDKGDYTYLYKMNELPEKLQGVYISRRKKGETKSTVEHAVLHDPLAVRYHRQGLFPVVWWGDMHLADDENIIAGVYPGFSLAEDGNVNASGVFFYRSTDNGKSWDILSRIPYRPDPEADPEGKKRLIRGYHEPAFEILQDGSFLCVIRTSDDLGNTPMYVTISTDKGKNWTKPKPFTRNGVRPRMVQLRNGVIALASGRPGMQVRFNVKGDGKDWTDPFEMLPYEDDKKDVSCGYPNLLVTGDNKFLLIYSDFVFQNDAGEIRKAIKVREITVDTVN